MKQTNLDLFKILITILLAGFLFVFYQYSQNGRYKFHNDNVSFVIDTKTGKIYRIKEGEPNEWSKAIK